MSGPSSRSDPEKSEPERGFTVAKRRNKVKNSGARGTERDDEGISFRRGQGGREGQDERGSCALDGFNAYPAPVFHHEPAGNGQPQPRPLTGRLRRDRKVKDLREVRLRNSGARIPDTDRDGFSRGFGGQVDGALSLHRLDRRSLEKNH